MRERMEIGLLLGALAVAGGIAAWAIWPTRHPQPPSPPYSVPMDAARTLRAALDVSDARPTCGIPAGVEVTADHTSEGTPALVVDGKKETSWHAGGYQGRLTLKFPQPIVFDRIYVAAHGSPAAEATYTVLPTRHGKPDLPMSAKRFVPEGSAAVWLSPIEIRRDTYGGLTWRSAGAPRGSPWARSRSSTRARAARSPT